MKIKTQMKIMIKIKITIREKLLVEDGTMAGLKLRTKLESAKCLKVAWRTAQDLGYSLTPIDDGSKSFTATKGSLLTSMLAGSLLAPYCYFQISTTIYADFNEVVLEKNKPWLTSGAVGVGRVNRQAEDLIGAIAGAIEKEGGSILEKKAF
jgi:hypothetical protein